MISAAAAVLVTAGLSASTAATASADPDGAGNIWTVVNADGGIFWRQDPEWNSAIRKPGFGVYNGDQVYLSCYKFGGPGPSGNTLWYMAGNLSRNQHDDGSADYGWVNDHYLTTPGTAASPDPQALECG